MFRYEYNLSRFPLHTNGLVSSDTLPFGTMLNFKLILYYDALSVLISCVGGQTDITQARQTNFVMLLR